MRVLTSIAFEYAHLKHWLDRAFAIIFAEGSPAELRVRVINSRASFRDKGIDIFDD